MGALCVSFGETEKIPLLEEFLVKIAKEMGEESIYLETGDQSWLLYP